MFLPPAARGNLLQLQNSLNAKLLASVDSSAGVVVAKFRENDHITKMLGVKGTFQT